MSGYQYGSHECQESYQQLTSQDHNNPLYTNELTMNTPGMIRKSMRVYVDKDIEFTVDVYNEQLTCGWLLSEVTRRYSEELNRIKKERER